MALRMLSERVMRRGATGAQTDKQTDPLSLPKENSTSTQVLPTPDSLPSTKRVEQSLDTCHLGGRGSQVSQLPIISFTKMHFIMGFDMNIVSVVDDPP